jgi:stage II sporulation protein AA (anti-sigma F factor antagonist)
MLTNLQVRLYEQDRRFRKGSARMSKFYRIHHDRSASVLELDLPDQIDTAEFDRLNESLLSELEGKPAGNWIIDLSRVNYMGSAMLGLIVNLRQQIKNIQGQLVLCALSPRLLGIFRTCCMERLFTIVRTREEALKLSGKNPPVIAGR